MHESIVNPRSVETQNWISTKYEHMVNGFIVDGDYYLIKTDKRTEETTEEWVWNDIQIPFAAVPDEVGLGIPVLVNTDDPKYTWVRKPKKYHPCWLRIEEKGHVFILGEVFPDKARLIIVDMLTGKEIGYGE